MNDLVLLTVNIKEYFDVKIETEKSIDFITHHIDNKKSINILVIDNKENHQMLFSKVIAFLDRTYSLIDSFNKDELENIRHVNLDFRLEI